MGKPQSTGNLVNAIAQDSSNNIGIGGAASGSYKLQVTGTTNLTGALTGTTGSFSVSVGNSNTGLDLTNSGALGYGNSINFYQNATKAVQIFTESSAANTSEIEFRTLVGGTLAKRFKIEATGAATFSSSVTAKSMKIENTSAASFLYFNNTAIPASNYIALGSAANDLYFQVNGSDRMVIKDNGNVGIGTSSPAKTLDVYNSANTNTAQIKVGDGGSTARAYLGTFSNNLYLSCGGTYSSGWATDGTNGIANIGMDAFNGGSTITFATAASNTTATERMRITNGGQIYNSNPPANAFAQIVYGSTTAGQSLGLQINAGTNSNDLSFRASNTSGSALFVVSGDGSIANPSHPTTANAANVHMTVGGTFYRSTSSLKYKNNVTDYDKGLDIVNQLRPVYYKGNNDGDTIFAGLIAEEVHELGLTEFVQYAEDGSPDSLAYPNMIALAFKAIQELEARVKQLENK